MQDFYYNNNTKIQFGNKLDDLNKEIVAFCGNVKNIFFVYGRSSIKEQGLYKRIIDILNQKEYIITEHSGVSSNPLLSHTRQGVEKAKATSAEVILAVGGGSVIDEAKAIAAGVKVDYDVWDFFNKGIKPQGALPVITVLTLPASGSEMNGGSVITHDETKEKKPMGAPCLNPKVSFLDPQYTCSLPDNYTAFGIVDIFSHLLEPYFNGDDQESVIQDNLVEGLMLSLRDISHRLSKNRLDYSARADMMWTATMAFNGIIFMGRGRIRYENHHIAHVLGGLFDIPHGASLSIIMPAWLKLRINNIDYLNKATRMAEKVLGVEKSLSAEKKALLAIQRLKEWFSSIGAPTSLRDYNISSDDFADIIDRIGEQGIYPGCTTNDLEQLLNSCL